MLFPVEAIVLRKVRITESSTVLTCFSHEYGKIDMFFRESSRRSHLDTLSYFTGQIQTKEKNTLTSIYRSTSFENLWGYPLYELAGWTIATLYRLLPLGLPYPRLFKILKALATNKTTECSDILLFLVQTCKDFGIAQCETEYYASLIQNPEGQLQVRQDIEAWIEAYQAS